MNDVGQSDGGCVMFDALLLHPRVTSLTVFISLLIIQFQVKLHDSMQLFNKLCDTLALVEVVIFISQLNVIT